MMSDSDHYFGVDSTILSVDFHHVNRGTGGGTSPPPQFFKVIISNAPHDFGVV